ncbi:MAG: alginate O-acetyltransferase AlgX-related protein [Desulfobaccales bacterium]
MAEPNPARWRRLGLNLLTLAGGLLAACLVLEILLHFLPAGFLYRSPHEMLATFDYRLGHGRYLPRRRVELHIPFGDLVGLDQTTRPLIAEPRRVRFDTDAYGFRNDHDYRGEPLLLVGDSFIAGSGGDQDDLLSAQLRQRYGFAAYNLGFPGELHSYIRFVQGFFQTHPSEARVLLFLFEGNDFPLPKDGAASAPRRTPDTAFDIHRKEFQQSLRRLLVYRFGYSLWHVIHQKMRPAAYPQVTVRKVKGHDDLYIGFLAGYVAVSRRQTYDGGADFLNKLARIQDRLAGIFFIPTKFRVYHGFLEGEPPSALAHPHWSFVKAQADRLGIRCVDLTGPLQEESRRLLAQGKLTFWKDDSHWNKYGMAVAARVIRDFLQPQ